MRHPARGPRRGIDGKSIARSRRLLDARLVSNLPEARA
jgi:hypothetical protein